MTRRWKVLVVAVVVPALAYAAALVLDRGWAARTDRERLACARAMAAEGPLDGGVGDRYFERMERACEDPHRPILTEFRSMHGYCHEALFTDACWGSVLAVAASRPSATADELDVPCGRRVRTVCGALFCRGAGTGPCRSGD